MFLQVRDENEMKENVADIKQLDEEIGIDSRVNIIEKKFRRKRKPEFGEDSEKKYGMKSELRCEGSCIFCISSCGHLSNFLALIRLLIL